MSSLRLRKNISYIPSIIEDKLPYEVNSYICKDFLDLDKIIKLNYDFCMILINNLYNSETIKFRCCKDCSKKTLNEYCYSCGLKKWFDI